MYREEFFRECSEVKGLLGLLCCCGMVFCLPICPVTPGLCYACLMQSRTNMREAHQIEGKVFDDFWQGICCFPCSIAQEYCEFYEPITICGSKNKESENTTAEKATTEDAK